MNSCWIFCGAPVSNDFKVIPPENAYVIAADSGYSFLKKMGINPDLLLGDFDSLTDEKPTDCEIISVAAEKDDTDTMLAVKTAFEKGYNDITIVASIGGRLDHTFANIQTLAYILDNRGTGRLIGENDIVEMKGKGLYTFDYHEEMYFSVFSYTSSAIITTEGTKYNVTDYCLDNKFPIGVSNEIVDRKCSVKVSEGQILIIFSKK